MFIYLKYADMKLMYTCALTYACARTHTYAHTCTYIESTIQYSTKQNLNLYSLRAQKYMNSITIILFFMFKMNYFLCIILSVPRSFITFTLTGLFLFK